VCMCARAQGGGVLAAELNMSTAIKDEAPAFSFDPESFHFVERGCRRRCSSGGLSWIDEVLSDLPGSAIESIRRRSRQKMISLSGMPHSPGTLPSSPTALAAVIENTPTTRAPPMSSKLEMEGRVSTPVNQRYSSPPPALPSTHGGYWADTPCEREPTGPTCTTEELVTSTQMLDMNCTAPEDFPALSAAEKCQTWPLKSSRFVHTAGLSAPALLPLDFLLTSGSLPHLIREPQPEAIATSYSPVEQITTGSCMQSKPAQASWSLPIPEVALSFARMVWGLHALIKNCTSPSAPTIEELEQLLRDMTTVDFNQKLKTFKFDDDAVRIIKATRRRLKNRNYTRAKRAREQAGHPRL